MSNQLYFLAKQSFLSKQIDWINDNIKVALLSASYTPNINLDQFLSNIPGAAIIATSANLTGKAATNGVASAAATLTFTAVSGAVIIYILGYQDTGTGSTSRLIFLDDTATGLPVTPNSGNITITWDTGPNAIFAL